MFKIIGGDGQQYGPVTVEQLREWIAAGRADAQTQVQREGEPDWRPLSSFPEFAQALAAKSPPAPLPLARPTPPPPGPDPVELANQILARDYAVNVGHCFGRAWDLLISDFWPILGVSSLMILLIAVSTAAHVGLVIDGPLVGGLYWYYLKRIRGHPAQLNDAFAGFQLAFLQLFLGLLVSGLLVGLGFLACVLPGIYLAVAWHLTLPIIIDQRLDFWAAMEVSRKVLTRHWWSVFLLALVALMINLAGVLLCCVGGLVTAPLTMLAWMFLYEDLFGPTKSEVRGQTSVVGGQKSEV